VLELCADVTVLRDGWVVGRFETAACNRSMLVEAMLGEETAEAEGRMEASRPAGTRQVRAEMPPALTVRGLRCRSLRGVDLELARGECVCLVGLAGSGREDVVYTICGASPGEIDRLEVNGQPIRRMSPAKARELGVALVPGNRLPGSMVNDFAMRENLTFASLPSVAGRLGRVNKRREAQTARVWVERFDIKPSDLAYRSRYLSGGNKQKMILAKWLSIAPTTMLIDEPTAGVDVGAVMTIYETLRRFVDEGGALLVSTSELEDALSLADRVVVFYEGRVTGELVRGRDEFSEQSLLMAMVAGRPAGTEPAIDSARGEV
jgi:ABC-type sugar transport system ATPase subunit